MEGMIKMTRLRDKKINNNKNWKPCVFLVVKSTSQTITPSEQIKDFE